MVIRFFSFGVLLLSASLFGMKVSVLDRTPVRTWEKNKLSNLVLRYDGIRNYNPSRKLSAQVRGTLGSPEGLVAEFVDSCCRTGYDDIDGRFVPLLEGMVANPIGRELIYRSMAKIIPRRACVYFIRKFLSHLSRVREEQGQLDLLRGFVTCMGVRLSHDSTRGLVRTFSTTSKGLCIDKLQKMYDEPVEIGYVVPQDITISGAHTGRVGNVISSLLGRIRLHLHNMETLLENLLFDLRFDPTSDDGFQLRGRTIVISGKRPYVSFMDSPLLKDRYGYIGVCTKSIKQEPEEVLFHEFSHYFGVTLENRKIAEMHTIDRELFRLGFSRGYLEGIEEKWTNTEEFRVIIGVIIGGHNIVYDYLNESEFNLASGRQNIRVSHSGLHFTRVPYLLLEIIESARGESVAEVRRLTRKYDAELDRI